MSPEPLPVLPRPLADPAYLYRLRQRALIRLREEEDAHTGRRVTRRWSLQRLGVLSTVLAPSLRLLLHGHAAFAEATAGMRTSAPQYGVPGLSGNPATTYGPPAPVSEAELGSPEAWIKSTIWLMEAFDKAATWNGTGGMIGTTPASAKSVWYRMPSGELLPLIAVGDAHAGFTCILRGDQAFYLADGSGIRGCVIRDRELVVSDSLFRVASSANGTADAIRAFGANMDDKTLAKETAPSKSVHILLTDGVPATFWPTNPNSSNPWITTVHLADNILEIHLMVYQAGGTFTIDLKKKKLVKFVDDASGGKWYGRKP